MITIRDVAAEAQVSPATVSRVFSDAARVKPSTRQRVLSVARELNYQPLPAARNIRRAQGGKPLNYAIGFVYARVRGAALDPFSTELNDAVVEALMDRGYAFRMIPAGDEGAVPIDVRERNVDGVIARGHGSVYREIMDHVPMVMLDAEQPDLRTYFLLPDYAEGIRQAVQLLVAGGRRRIDVMAGDPGCPIAVHFTQSVYSGYCQALMAAGLTPNAARFHSIAGTPKEGFEQTVDCLAEPANRPDAIIAPDGALIGVYRAIAEAGLRIPGDIAIVGINGLSFGPYLPPPATTVDVHLRELAEAGVARLIEMIETGKQRFVTENTHTTLVVRASTPTLPAMESQP